MRIIGITGKARSGKDTLADLMINQVTREVRNRLVLPVRKIPMAMALKRITSVLISHLYDEYEFEGTVYNNYDPSYWFDGDGKDIQLSHAFLEEYDNKTIREYLQEIGSAMKDAVNPTLWADITCTQIREQQYKWWSTITAKEYEKALIVVPDVRYDHEAEKLRQHFNADVIGVARDEAKEVRAHHSEAGINPDLITMWVDNNGSIEELEDKAKRILSND